MPQKRRRRSAGSRPELCIPHILAWADAYHKSTGKWPNLNCGPIKGEEETWRRIDSALRIGLRGLRGGTSLARLLAECRGVRNQGALPPLTHQQILAWVDAHRRRTGSWPTSESGELFGQPGETWKGIDHALRLGMRGLPGDSSLSRLLEQRRGIRNLQGLPRLTTEQILIWADEHFRRTGAWPMSKSGPIPHTRGETWSGVNAALRSGRRSFRGGSSLARLLARERGVRNPKAPPALSVKQILQWADDHYRRTGAWPTRQSGPIPQALGETWSMVDRALCNGHRGLRGGLSLYRLLEGRGKS